jgi:hypothetical protein
VPAAQRLIWGFIWDTHDLFDDLFGDTHKLIELEQLRAAIFHRNFSSNEARSLKISIQDTGRRIPVALALNGKANSCSGNEYLNNTIDFSDDRDRFECRG